MNGFEAGVLKVLKEVGHVIAWPFEKLDKVVKLTATALEDEPKAKAVVVGLLDQVKIIVKDTGLVISDGAAAVSEKGLNWADDQTTIHAIGDDAKAAKALWDYVKNVFLP